MPPRPPKPREHDRRDWEGERSFAALLPGHLYPATPGPPEPASRREPPKPAREPYRVRARRPEQLHAPPRLQQQQDTLTARLDRPRSLTAIAAGLPRAAARAGRTPSERPNPEK